MPARNFTKKEQILFYINIGVICFAFGYAYFYGGGDVMSVTIRSMVHSSISQGIIGVAAVGLFLSLMGAQFCKGWNIFYIVLQVLLILNILGGLCIAIGVNVVVPSEVGEITDPDTLAMLKNVTDSSKRFLDRNQDFPPIYKTIQETFNFCGFYSKEDSMGISCPYSSQEVCAQTNETVLSILLSFLKKLMSIGIRNLLLFLIIEIIIIVFIIIAYRSIKGPYELKKKEYSLSVTQPTVVNENRTALIPNQQQPQHVSIPGMPANGQGYYYAQPVASEPAKPVMSQ